MRDEKSALAAIESGLPIVGRPFEVLAKSAGLTEDQLISEIGHLQQKNIIRRFGAVVKHRSLGFKFNAMCVWDIPDQLVSQIGSELIKYPFVTLCYRRRRSLPTWPFNIYCMIHGTDSDSVKSLFEKISKDLELTSYPRRMLLSPTCFKQRGARYYSDDKNQLSELDREIINELQNGLGVTSRPFSSVAEKFAITETELLCRLSELKERGRLSRFGPMYNVERFGGNFVLVAMEVPEDRFEQITAIVNSYPEVAHNYEREHKLNMWFVLATESEQETAKVLKEIEAKTNLKTYALPKEKEFFLELKFEV